MSVADEEQDACPLLEAVGVASSRVRTPLFFPGHKMGRGAPPKLRILLRDRMMDGGAPFAHDLPELPELDNLFAPEGPIRDAEALAAKAYVAQKSWFLVNGSTAGIVAAILACVKVHRSQTKNQNKRAVIILPRNVHRSAINGLVLSGADPVFLNPIYDDSIDIAFGCDTNTQLKELLEKHKDDVAAVLLVSPTYHGVLSNVREAAEHAKQHQVPLILDEAHGAHLQFLDGVQHLSGLRAGADIVIQSTHKTLTSFTQSAMLHLAKETIFPTLHSAISTALATLQTSSPSYLLMASLDAARSQFASPKGGGVSLLNVAVSAANSCRQGLKDMGFRVLEKPADKPSPNWFLHLDPLKVTVIFDTFQMDGYEVDEILIEEFGVYAECPSARSLIFAFGPGSSSEDTRQVLEAMGEVYSRAQKTSPIGNSNDLESSKELKKLDAVPATSKFVMSPREAFFHPVKIVSQEDAIGKTSAEMICPYPPGIPAVLPGEIITVKCLQHLMQCITQGGIVEGCADSTLQTFVVLDQ